MDSDLPTVGGSLRKLNSEFGDPHLKQRLLYLHFKALLERGLPRNHLLGLSLALDTLGPDKVDSF